MEEGLTWTVESLIKSDTSLEQKISSIRRAINESKNPEILSIQNFVLTGEIIAAIGGKRSLKRLNLDGVGFQLSWLKLLSNLRLDLFNIATNGRLNIIDIGDYIRKENIDLPLVSEGELSDDFDDIVNTTNLQSSDDYTIIVKDGITYRYINRL